MSTFSLEIATPEKLVFQDEVQELIVRTTEGDVAILKGHTNFAANLDIGEMRIKLADGGFKSAAVGEGFISVITGEVSVIAVKFEWKEDIDLKWAEDTVAELTTRLASNLDDETKNRTERKLKRAQNRIKIVSK